MEPYVQELKSELQKILKRRLSMEEGLLVMDILMSQKVTMPNGRVFGGDEYGSESLGREDTANAVAELCGLTDPIDLKSAYNCSEKHYSSKAPKLRDALKSELVNNGFEFSTWT